MEHKVLLACAAIGSLVLGTACSGKVSEDPGGDGANQALNAGADKSGEGTAVADPVATASGEGNAEPASGCTEPPKPPGGCYPVVDALVCTDPNGKLYAEKICAAQGAVATAIDVDAKGGCVVTCCAPTPPPPPPPPPPPQACTWSAIGDGTTCLSYVDLKTKAEAICASEKAAVTAMYFANDCPNGSTAAKLECCSSAPPPPVPPPPPPSK